MGTIDIDYGSLGIGLLLMLIPVYFLWHFKTGLLKPVLIGTVRMIIQLFLIGAYLRFLFEWNNPFINFLWVIIMVGVAAETALTRTRLKRGILMIPISIAFFVTVVLVGLYFLGFVLKLDNIFSAQYFIPVFGIIMGNMLGVNVIGLNTYYAGLRREQQLYYFLLGNGATRNEAIAPFVRQALIKAFSPGHCQYGSNRACCIAGNYDWADIGRKFATCGYQISDYDCSYHCGGIHAFTNDDHFSGLTEIIRQLWPVVTGS